MKRSILRQLFHRERKEIGAGNEIRTRDCRYLRAFDAFMICLQAIEFNSFLIQSDHKGIARNHPDALQKGHKKGHRFQDFVLSGQQSPSLQTLSHPTRVCSCSQWSSKRRRIQ